MGKLLPVWCDTYSHFTVGGQFSSFGVSKAPQEGHAMSLSRLALLFQVDLPEDKYLVHRRPQLGLSLTPDALQNVAVGSHSFCKL